MGPSLTILTAVLVSASASRAPDEARVAVIVGANVGLSDETPLAYAETDAERFRDMLREVGGVEADRIEMVTRGGAEAVRQALVKARGRLEELHRNGRTALIVYVSSHADSVALHLQGTTFPLAELKASVMASPADLRLVVVDACRTRVPGRTKGGRPVPEVKIAAERPSNVEGMIMLTAAGDGEPAQEWEFLRGSLFTHHVLSGLRGLADSNTDGQVSLGELYSYAYAHTAAGSVLGRSGLQRPSFDIDIAGWGDWSLTRPSSLGAAISWSEELEGTFWVADARQELVAEVSKRRGERVRLGVVPGWYRIVRPEGEFADAVDLNLAWGGERVLEGGAFARIPLRRTVIRGVEPIALRPWHVSVSYGLSGIASSATVLGHHVDGAISRDWGAASVRLRSGYSVGSGSLLGAPFTERAWESDLGAGYSFHLWVLVLTPRFEARAALVHQSLGRKDEQVIAQSTGVVEPTRFAWVFGGAASVNLSVPLTERLSVEAEVSLAALAVPQWNQSVMWVGRPAGRVGLNLAF